MAQLNPAAFLDLITYCQTAPDTERVRHDWIEDAGDVICRRCGMGTQAT